MLGSRIGTLDRDTLRELEDALRLRVVRILAISVLVLGVVLAVFGVMLYLNVLSLRDLVLETHLPVAIAAVFDVRDEMSHRRAQGLELLIGSGGAALALVAGLWLRVQPARTSNGASNQEVPESG